MWVGTVPSAEAQPGRRGSNSPLPAWLPAPVLLVLRPPGLESLPLSPWLSSLQLHRWLPGSPSCRGQVMGQLKLHGHVRHGLVINLSLHLFVCVSNKSQPVYSHTWPRDGDTLQNMCPGMILSLCKQDRVSLHTDYSCLDVTTWYDFMDHHVRGPLFTESMCLSVCLSPFGSVSLENLTRPLSAG